MDVTLFDLPIGLDATGTRREFGSMGTIDVSADKYYGAQTARSLIYVSIGDDIMPSPSMYDPRTMVGEGVAGA